MSHTNFLVRIAVGIIAILSVACGGRENSNAQAREARDITTPYLSGVSEFHWATSQEFDQVAMNFRFQLPESPATCTFTTAKCVRWNDLGLSSWQTTTTDRSSGWGGWSPHRGGDYVVAGPLDTRFELEVDEHICEIVSATHNSYSGVLDHYTFGKNVESRSLPGGGSLSMAISLECDAAFDVLNAEVGYEATLYNWDTLDVVTVNQDFIGNLMVGSGHESLESKNSGYFTGHSGDIEGAVLYVEAPDGPHVSTPFHLVSVSNGHMEQVVAGPGEYDIEVTRGSVPDMGSWWLLAYGLEAPLDLGQGLLSESAIDF